MKILLVEDETSLRQAIRQYLEVDGYVVTTAATFAVASMALNDYDYDCVVVDIGLPDGNGLNLIRQLKTAEKGGVPPRSGLIIISAKDSLDDKLMGLELGSDDYITKPFHLPELNARIKSVLRRRFFGGDNLIRYGEIVADPLSHQVTIAGQPLELTEKEYHLLLFFLTNVNRLLTKSAIAEYVWGDHMDMADSHDFLYTHIKNLRRKLIDAGCPDYIKTRYGAGYLFTTP